MEKLLRIIKSKTARTSAFYYCGNFIVSFGNYVFHLILIRLLAPAYYGEFLTYISFLYLLAIPSGTISVVVTKHIADYYGKRDTVSINHFFYFIIGKIIAPSLVLGFAVILFSTPLSHLFKAEPVAFVVLGISIFTSLIGSVLRSYVSAFQLFNFVTVLGFVDIIIKVILAVILVNLGLNATGPVIAILLTGLIILSIIYFKVKTSIYPKAPGKSLGNIKIRSNLFYSFLYSAGTLSLMSVDVLMVRIYFDTHTSGLYSGLSMLGRMIYFGVTPLSGLLLPMVSHRFAAHLNTKTVLRKLGLVSLVIGLVGVSIFSLNPEALISLLSGRNYLEVSGLLPLFAVTMLIFALSYFLLTFLIAVNRQKVNFILLLTALAQPLAIFISHDSITTVVYINLCLHSALLLALLIYYKTRTSNIN